LYCTIALYNGTRYTINLKASFESDNSGTIPSDASQSKRTGIWRQ
jgi:hypothetical protein